MVGDGGAVGVDGDGLRGRSYDLKEVGVASVSHDCWPVAAECVLPPRMSRPQRCYDGPLLSSAGPHEVAITAERGVASQHQGGLP